MTRIEQVRCDWCTSEDDPADVDPVELGWITVELYDMGNDEVKGLDFCSEECVVNYFQ